MSIDRPDRALQEILASVPTPRGTSGAHRWSTRAFLAVLTIVIGTSFNAPAQLGASSGSSPTAAVAKPVQPQTPATRRMIELLQRSRVETEAHAEQTIFLNDVMVERDRRKVKQATNEEERLDIQPRLALQLLNAGKSREALQEFESFRSRLAQLGWQLQGHNQEVLDISRAMCYLRMGEQENCIRNHNPDSCLLPISAAGVHQFQDGSRGAIEVLTEHLKSFPQDLRARWLLNVAEMTVGDYPTNVPPQWLIPPRVFQSDFEIKRFPD